MIKCEFEYDGAEIVRLVLVKHEMNFPPPIGYFWEGTTYYSGVKVELVEIQTPNDNVKRRKTMKGEFEYNGDEIVRLVLIEHEKNFTPPIGYFWEGHTFYNGVKVDLVDLPAVYGTISEGENNG